MLDVMVLELDAIIDSQYGMSASWQVVVTQVQDLQL